MLPDALQEAIAAELEEQPQRELAGATRELSTRFRSQRARPEQNCRYSARDATAYAAYRLPATYAAVSAVLDDVQARCPELQPATLLDVGSGPGTAAWAGCAHWPRISHVTALDRDPHMLALGRRLAQRAPWPSLAAADWRAADLTESQHTSPADLVIAAYTLVEIPGAARPALIDRLWSLTRALCVLVEPGTPAGFAIVQAAGAQLAAHGAHAVAPFPLGWPCLVGPEDWTHFAARVPRSRAHRAFKAGELSYEDEKYSYVALARSPGAPIAARVLRHPQTRRGHIRLVLCTATGVKEIVVPRSRADAYRRARDLTWGSAILPDEAPLFGLSADQST